MKKKMKTTCKRFVTAALCGLMFLTTACGGKTADAEEQATSLYVYSTATLIRYNEDDHAVIVGDNMTEEVAGNFSFRFASIRHVTADVIRTDEGSWLYKDDTLTELTAGDQEIFSCSREGEALMGYHYVDIDGAYHYDSCWMMDGDERIPIVEAEDGILMASGLFSPHGEAFVYSLHDTEEEMYALYVFRDGASTLIAENEDGVYALKTTDDGSLVWYYESDGRDTKTIYASVDGEVTEIGTLFGEDRAMNCYLSFDAREMIFYDGHHWNLSIRGAEAEKLRGDYGILAPAGMQTHSNGTDLGVTTFCGTYYYDAESGNIYRIEEDGTPSRILRKIPATASYALLRDEHTFIVADEDGIRRYDLEAEDPEESAVVLVDEGVLYADISFDGKHIAYVDEDRALWILEDGEEPVRLLNNITRTVNGPTTDEINEFLGCAVYFEAAGMYYFKNDGVLYRSADGTDEEIVDDIEGDVFHLYCDPLYLTFYTEDGDTTLQYMTLDGETFGCVER